MDRETRDEQLIRDKRNELIRELAVKRVGKYIPNRANTVTQKREVIERLFQLWYQNPDMRFGQLIGNVLKDPQLYYMEDYELTENLEAFYEHRKTL